MAAGGPPQQSYVPPVSRAPGANDFCNSFWARKPEGQALVNGLDDEDLVRLRREGYDALQARMKGGSSTLAELRTIYKERAVAEEDYAKRMARLSRVPFGGADTGRIQLALSATSSELDAVSKTHTDLAGFMRNLEAQTAKFLTDREMSRKAPQAAVEKLWKTKGEQEKLVTKAKNKYREDCILINGLSASSHLSQGRELDKITGRLERAQQSVQVNEREYHTYVGILRTTTQDWNALWKEFCDLCQDQEEQRINFIRTSLWDYANALASACLANDESAERTRESLEQCNPSVDVCHFASIRGTGNDILEAPGFQDFSKSSGEEQNKVDSRKSRYVRLSNKPAAAPGPKPAEEVKNAITGRSGSMATIPTAGSSSTIPSMYSSSNVDVVQSQPSLPALAEVPLGTPTRTGGPPASYGGASSHAQGNGASPSKSQAAGAMAAISNALSMSSLNEREASPPPKPPSFAPPAPRKAEPAPSVPPPSTQEPTAPTQSDDEDDLLLQTLNKYKNAKSPQLNQSQGPGGVAPSGENGRSPRRHESTASSSMGNYWADQPGYEPPTSPQRVARSPSPASGGGGPRASMMQPPQHTSSSTITGVLSSYQQSFPGERTISRPSSRQGSAASNGSGSVGPSAAATMASSVPPSTNRPGQPFNPQASAGRDGRAPLRNSTSFTGSPGPQPPRADSMAGFALDASGNVIQDSYSPSQGQPQGHSRQPSAPGLGGPFNAAGQQPINPNVPRPYQPSGSPQRQTYVQPPAQPRRHESSSSLSFPSNQAQRAPSPKPYSSGRHESTSSLSAFAPPGNGGMQSRRSPSPSFGQPRSRSPSLNVASMVPSFNPRAPSPQVQALHAQQAAQAQAHAQAAAAHAQSMAAQAQARAPLQSQQGMHNPYGATSPAPTAYGAPAAQPQQPPYFYPQQPAGAAPAAHPAYMQQQLSQRPSQPNLNGMSSRPSSVVSLNPGRPTSGLSIRGPPPPTGQYTDTGKPIQFYVSAIHPYEATNAEEFSFAVGDVIAVTSTAPDGWWQGELLGVNNSGGSTFPSNFTELLP